MNWGTLPLKVPSFVPFLTHLETEAMPASAHGTSGSSRDVIWPARMASLLEEAGLTVKWEWILNPDDPGRGVCYSMKTSAGNVVLEADLVFEPEEAIKEGSSARKLVRQGVVLAWDGAVPQENNTFVFTFQGDHARLTGTVVDQAPDDTEARAEGRLYDGRRLFEAMLSVLKAELRRPFEHPTVK